MGFWACLFLRSVSPQQHILGRWRRVQGNTAVDNQVICLPLWETMPSYRSSTQMCRIRLWDTGFHFPEATAAVGAAGGKTQLQIFSPLIPRAAGASGKESVCQSRRRKICGFEPWVRKIPWRRKWQPSPVFLPGESPGQRSLAGYSPWGRRARHNWATNTHTHIIPRAETLCIAVKQAGPAAKQGQTSKDFLPFA